MMGMTRRNRLTTRFRLEKRHGTLTAVTQTTKSQIVGTTVLPQAQKGPKIDTFWTPHGCRKMSLTFRLKHRPLHADLMNRRAIQT